MPKPPPNPAERVRDCLRDWLDTTGVTQKELATDLNKTQVWLQKVLKGENDVRLRDLDGIADALRTTASDLVRGEDERYRVELAPTEMRIIEKMRHRPAIREHVAALLNIPAEPKSQPGRRREP